MLESKSVCMDRLRKERRWEEASLWRDQKRKELREECQTRAEANEAAWEAMSEQFPPLQESEEQPDPTIQLLDINPDDFGGEPDVSRDIVWKYENLARSGITAKDAPSLGAWGLLLWARGNRPQFFERMLPKAMVSKEKQPYEKQEVEDLGIEFIDQMIKDMEHELDCEFVVDTDGTIRKTVTGQMEDLERRFQLDLAPDARESWILQTMRTVEQAITAVTKHRGDSKAG